MSENYDVNLNIKETGGEAANNTIKKLNESLKDIAAKGGPELTKTIDGLKDKLSGLAGSAAPAAAASIDALGVALVNPIAGAIALAAALAGVGLSMAFNMKDKIDEFADLGDRMGMSADQAYYLSTAAKDASGSIDEVIGMSNRLAKAMANSGVEMKGVGAAFVRIGVETRDTNGKLRDSNDVLDELTAKWEESAKTTSDYADMQQILGKSFEAAMNTRKATKEAEEEAQTAYEKGIGITKQSLEITNDSEKAQRKLGGVFNAMGAIMVETVIPAFTALTNWFIKSYETGGIVAKVFVVIAEVTEVVMVAVKLLTSAVMTLTTAFDIVSDAGQTAFKSILQALSGDFSGAAKTFEDGTDRIKGRIKNLGTDLNNTWKGTWDNSTLRKMLESGGDVMSVINRKVDLTAPTKKPTARGGAGGEVITEDKPVKEQIDPILALVDALTKQSMAQDNVNKVDLVTVELQNKKYNNSDKELKQKAISIANLIDESNAAKITTDAIASMKKTTDSFVNSLDKEHLAHTMNKRDLDELNEIQKLELDTAAEIQKLKDKHIWSLKEETRLTNELANAKLKVAVATVKAKEEDKSWTAGWTSATAKYSEDVQNNFKTASDMANNTFKTMEDALVNFTMNGKFNFSDFARSILADLARIAAKAAVSGIMNFIGGMINGAGGFGWGTADTSGIGTAMSLMAKANGGAFNNGREIAFANGGVVTQPTNFGLAGGNVGLMGEAGPEAIMPLSTASDGKLGVRMIGGGTSGSNVSVGQINITVKGGTTNEQTGAAVSDAVVKQLKNMIQGEIKEAKRYGNQLNPRMA